MSLKIMRATSDMADDIGSIKAVSWKAAYKGIVPDGYLNGITPQYGAERIKKDLSGGADVEHYLICIRDKAAGVLTLLKCRDDDMQDAGEIAAIYFHPDFSGKGNGRRAMDFALKRLKELGYAKVILWVFEENMRARKFYEKCGFAADGTKKEIVLEKPLTGVRYVKNI